MREVQFFRRSRHSVAVLRLIFMLVFSMMIFCNGVAKTDHVMPVSIEIFTTEDNPILIPFEWQPRTVSYDLNAPGEVLNKVNDTLPADPQTAQLQAQTLISDVPFNTTLRQAYQGIARAASYGLTRYPAIVFDHGKAVTYGQTDLNAAVRTYQQWESSHAAS